MRRETSIYLSQALVLDKGKNSEDFIAVKCIDLTGSSINLEEEIKKLLKPQGYNVVEDIKDANTIIYVTLKNITHVDNKTATKIKKFLQYQSIIFLSRKNALNLNENEKINFEITDEGVSFGSGNATPISQNDTFLQTVSKLDFISGAAIGATIGFFVGNAAPVLGVPWGVTIGVLLGGTASVSLQQLTNTKNYIGIVDLRVSRSTEKDFDSKQKLMTKQGTNIVKEAYINTQSNWIDYQTEMLVLAEHQMKRDKAVAKIEEIIAKAVSTMSY